MTRPPGARLTTTALMLFGVSLITVQSNVAAEIPAQRSWAVNSDSLLYVKVFKAGTIGSGLAHDHVIRASRWDATLDFDPSSAATCKLLLEIPVLQLVVDEPWLRERARFRKSLDAGDREKVRKSMLAKDQLDAEKYPVIRIEGSGCVAAAKPGSFDIQLAVTVRGRTKRLTTRVNVSQEGEQLRASGRFRVRHADFGMKPYSAVLGAVANAEPLDFSADIVAKR